MLELLLKEIAEDEERTHQRRNPRENTQNQKTRSIARGIELEGGLNGSRERRGLQEWGERVRGSGINGINGVGTVQGEFTLAGQSLSIQSNDPSQVQSNQLGESCHPMIISQINNPRYNHLALLHIRNAASELKQTQLDLADYLDEQALLYDDFIAQMAQDLEDILQRISSQARLSAGDDGGREKASLEDAERRVEQLTAENEALQEHIFDMEQRMVGVELEVDRRLKERGRQAERQAAAAAREESKELIEQLQAQVAALREQCSKLESQGLPSELREREYQLGEAERAIALREQSLREETSKLQTRKQAAYQREHELLAAEENLSKKISELRKKEAELSEWEAELTRKSRAVRTVREVLEAKDTSRDELNRSGEISLKSFGRRKEEDELRIAPASLEQLGIHRNRTLNNEEQPQSPRDPLAFTRDRQAQLRSRQNTDHSYVGRQKGAEERRFNPHLSSYQPREASPFRMLQELKGRSNGHSHQYILPKASPREPRQASRSSRISASRQRSIQREESGLGSKLSRLREQIKKQIESIK